jgi:hypothetical protein
MTFFRGRDARAAARLWRLLRDEYMSSGLLLHSSVASEGRTVTIASLAPSRPALLTIAASQSHVRAARWALAQAQSVWSGVFALEGVSSTSGAGTHDTWAEYKAKEALGRDREEPAERDAVLPIVGPRPRHVGDRKGVRKHEGSQREPGSTTPTP